MKAHERFDQDARDRAALYVLGTMEANETSQFEEHLEICEPCRLEIASLRPVVDDLALSAPAVDPPAGLRARVLERLCRSDFTFLPAADRNWLSPGVPGVETFQLWLDSNNERQTMLIHMAAGASLPMHRHGDTEECFVVRGDLSGDGLSMTAGDYVRFEAGTSHTVSTRDGCLLLINSSLHDRAIDPPTGSP